MDSGFSFSLWHILWKSSMEVRTRKRIFSGSLLSAWHSLQKVTMSSSMSLRGMAGRMPIACSRVRPPRAGPERDVTTHETSSFTLTCFSPNSTQSRLNDVAQLRSATKTSPWRRSRSMSVTTPRTTSESLKSRCRPEGCWWLGGVEEQTKTRMMLHATMHNLHSLPGTSMHCLSKILQKKITKNKHTCLSAFVDVLPFTEGFFILLLLDALFALN